MLRGGTNRKGFQMGVITPVSRKIYQWLGSFESGFAFTALVLVFLFVLTSVFTRYVLRVSLAWLEELTMFAFIGSIFVGAAVVTRQKGHIKLEFLSLTVHRQKIIDIVNLALELIALGATSYFAYLTFHYMMGVWAIPAYSATLVFMHQGWIKSLPFLGSTLWSIELVILIFRDCLSLMKKAEEQ